MAELGSRGRASDDTADINVKEILRERGGEGLSPTKAVDTSRSLRQYLESKGLKGFKKGGKVRKTGPAKVHKGEFVVKKSAAKKAGPQKLAALNRGKDINRLKKIKIR